MQRSWRAIDHLFLSLLCYNLSFFTQVRSGFLGALNICLLLLLEAQKLVLRLATCLPQSSGNSLTREKHKICSEQREIERDVVRLIIQFYSAFWASCTVAFRGIPLSVQWFVIHQLSWLQLVCYWWCYRGGFVTLIIFWFCFFFLFFLREGNLIILLCVNYYQINNKKGFRSKRNFLNPNLLTIVLVHHGELVDGFY